MGGQVFAQLLLAVFSDIQLGYVEALALALDVNVRR